MPPDWLSFVKVTAEKYGVEPAFALAVAEVESSGKGKRFRFGKMGRSKYYGPFGVHQCFMSKWDISDPYINTEVGIKALSRYKDSRRALKKYNTAFNETYFRRIKTLEARNNKEQIWKK